LVASTKLLDVEPG